MPSAEYMREYRARRRARLVEQLGSKCVRCGSTEDLHFDHIDPTTKVAQISGWRYSKAALAEEMEKVQLLCQVCHSEKSKAEFAERFTKSHGSYSNYKVRGCRCGDCRTAYLDVVHRANLKYRGRI